MGRQSVVRYRWRFLVGGHNWAVIHTSRKGGPVTTG
jgi:hypothetical protein